MRSYDGYKAQGKEEKIRSSVVTIDFFFFIFVQCLGKGSHVCKIGHGQYESATKQDCMGIRTIKVPIGSAMKLQAML